MELVVANPFMVIGPEHGSPKVTPPFTVSSFTIIVLLSLAFSLSLTFPLPPTVTSFFLLFSLSSLSLFSSRALSGGESVQCRLCEFDVREIPHHESVLAVCGCA